MISLSCSVGCVRLILNNCFCVLADTLSDCIASSNYLWFAGVRSVRLSVVALNCSGLMILECLRCALNISCLWLRKTCLDYFLSFGSQMLWLSSRFVSSYFNLSSIFISFPMDGVRQIWIIIVDMFFRMIGLRGRLYVCSSWLSIMNLVRIYITGGLILSLRSALNICLLGLAVHISSLRLIISSVSLVVHSRIGLFHIRIVVIISRNVLKRYAFAIIHLLRSAIYISLWSRIKSALNIIG